MVFRVSLLAGFGGHISMIDPITAVSFSIFENKGVYALLLGSGLSRAAQIPTGWEVTLDLVRRVALLSGENEQADWSEWYQAKFGGAPNYSGLLNSLANTADQRRAVLHSYIEPTEEDFRQGRKIPTKAHRAIAKLMRDGFIRVVVTTNFDRLLENSLREIGVEPTVIRSDDDIRGAIPLTHARCYILSLIGDYLDTRIRNTDIELSSYSKKMNGLLDRIFDEFGLIVCGWSGDWDEALRFAIARTPNRRYAAYSAARGKLTPLADDLVQKRAAHVVPIAGADEFFEALQRNIETQAKLQRQNPRSIDLLVASAKRFMGRPEERISLEALINEETAILVALLDGKEFEANGPWSDQRFKDAVGRYEAITEPTARLFGVLGRWGDGSEFKSVVDVIRNLMTVQPRSGIVVLNNLRTYPARVLFFAYGIGLLKSERYSELFRLFASSLETADGSESNLVSSLLAWEPDDKNHWNVLDEFAPEHNRRMPLSDHMHRVFGDWVSDYLVFKNTEFTRIFESFELLGALVYIGLSHDLKSLEELTKRPSENFTWAPIGRASWDGSTRRAVFNEWGRPEVSKRILAAGFAQGNSSYMAMAVTSLERLSNRLLAIDKYPIVGLYIPHLAQRGRQPVTPFDGASRGRKGRRSGPECLWPIAGLASSSAGPDVGCAVLRSAVRHRGSQGTGLSAGRKRLAGSRLRPALRCGRRTARPAPKNAASGAPRGGVLRK